MKRPNLRVITGGQVNGLTFDGARVTGVTYSRNGKEETVSAGREVILSGGSVNSPQLLQLAGIGPADHLKNLGINVRIDNPNVGRNLEDHIGINYTYRANCPTINQQLGPWWGKLSAGIRYLAFRDGPLSVSLNQAGGFIRTSPDHASGPICSSISRRSRPSFRVRGSARSSVLIRGPVSPSAGPTAVRKAVVKS
jgi:choline dehydrogenase